jgi:hypothetical protein
VTQTSTLIGPAPTFQSSTLGPPIAPSPGTYSWYLDSDASFHMTPHSGHLSSLRPSRHCIIHTADGSPLSVIGQGTLSSDSFHDPDACYIQDRRTDHLVETGPHRRDSHRLWELDWLHLPSATSASPVSSACDASSTSSFAHRHHHLGHLSDPRQSALLHRGLLGSVSGRESLDYC